MDHCNQWRVRIPRPLRIRRPFTTGPRPQKLSVSLQGPPLSAIEPGKIAYFRIRFPSPAVESSRFPRILRVRIYA
jgi:hypothetical protein